MSAGDVSAPGLADQAEGPQTDVRGRPARPGCSRPAARPLSWNRPPAAAAGVVYRGGLPGPDGSRQGCEYGGWVTPSADRG